MDNSKAMKLLLRWIWTFPIGGILIILFPNWQFIGVAIMGFGLIAFFIDLFRSHTQNIGIPKEGENIVKVTWISLPKGTKSPFRFNGWTDVGYASKGIFSTITNELTYPRKATNGKAANIKLPKGLNEVQTIINTDGSRIVILMTLPSKLELWFMEHLGMVSCSEDSKLIEDGDPARITYYKPVEAKSV